MSSNNSYQGPTNSPARNIPAKYGSVQSVSTSNSSYNGFNTNAGNSFTTASELMSRVLPNSPSKSTLHGLAMPGHSVTQQPSPMFLAESGRRPSANLSRMSFLYNNSYHANNNANNQNIAITASGGSSGNNDGYFGSNHPNTFFLPNLKPDRAYFQTSSEILACDRAWENPNLMAIATPRNLQLLKVSNSEISLETELSMKPPGRIKIGTISDLAFGHQQYGRYLAASTITGSVHVYNLDRGTRMKTTLTGHQRAVNSISFNTISSHILASGSQDGKILIWDLKASNTKPSMTLCGNADAVRCNSFSPKKSNILAAVFDSGVVEKWDLRKNNTWEKRINAHTGPALSVHWHPELEYIVTGGRDKQLQVWNLGSGIEAREPSHVINTSGPISKAKWCKGRGNGSILNTDIAVSFFNDDPCVQIWNLNRKYIPKCVIDGHSAPITQIIWRTPKNLISCSKDKTLIQYDVTKEPKFIDNIPMRAFAWNPSEKFDFAFIKQKKSQFEGPFTSARHVSQSNELNTVDESEQANTTTGSISTVNNTNQVSVSTPESGMQLYEMAASSPGSHSPTLTSTLKIQRQQIQRRQASYAKPPLKSIPPPAWVTPVHIPLLSNNMEKFKFLSSNYMIQIPEGADITDVCEYNSMLAASVGYFRDCQTWKTIKLSIILDIDSKQENEIESKLNNFTFQKTNSYSQSESHLGTSYGSESDQIHRKESGLSGSYASEEYHFKHHGKKVNEINYNESAIMDEDEEHTTSKQNNATVSEKRIFKENQESSASETTSQTNGIQESSMYKNDSSSSINLKEQEFKPDTTALGPIDIDSNIKNTRTSSMARQYRYSFTGSSVDMDDEKCGSPLSASFSPLIHRTRSKILMSMKQEAHEDPITNIGKSVDTRFSGKSDNKSQLTAILKESNTLANSETSTATNQHNASLNSAQHIAANKLRVPWNPDDLIEQAAQYSSDQGDILMCATLALLFTQLYPNSISHAKAEEWIFCYHEHLLRSGHFVSAAAVLKIASETYESFKTIGQTNTSVKILCCNCGKPILNEESKENYKNKLSKLSQLGNEIDNEHLTNNFGFWYCDKCKQIQSPCCYCNEPIKGNAITLIGCGHVGHFGCFRNWFIDQKQCECPVCGVLCIK